MPEQPNKSIVRRYIEELNRRNLAILDELVSDAFREQVTAGYTRNVTAFPDYRVEIHDMIAEGDQVVVEWSHTGVHQGMYDGVGPTGRTITGHAITVYNVVGGRITGARGTWDRGEVWQQLGLIPDTETILRR
jgi:predicted ester cyclase